MVTTTSAAFTPSDPNAIYRQLYSILQSSEDPHIRQVWGASVKQGTSDRLLQTFVRAVEMAQYSIDRATEERHLDTAMLESSIRAILRDMDVRTMRKIPAGLNLYVSRSTPTNVSRVIPAFSQFTGGGRTFYNRYPVQFGVGETVAPARFYVGTIRTETFISSGEDFQEWLSPEGNFTVSDGRESHRGVEYSDTIVKVAGTPVRVAEHDQWWDMLQDTDKAVRDRTTSDGRCQLVFGDSKYGYLPPAGANVQVQYVLTNGSADNSGIFNSNLIMISDSTITAYPVTSASGSTVPSASINGGANEIPADTYRKTGPLLFASAGTATRRKTAQAWAVNYPGVADALVLGQAKINPNDRRYMNVIQACILKGGDGIDPNDYTMSASDASGWLQHFNRRRPSVSGHVVFHSPVPSSPKLDIVLECMPYVTLALAEEAARQAIRDLYAYKPGTLRGTILLSDLTDSAKYSTQGIKGVRHNGQINDLVTYSRAPLLALSAEITTGQKAANGEYVFHVIAICDVYEGATLIEERSAPSNAIVYNANGTANPQVSFNPVVGAKRYEIYCRRPGTTTYNRVAELDSRTFEFTLTGQSTFSTTLMPMAQPVAFRFPKLGDLKVTAVYAENEW